MRVWNYYGRYCSLYIFTVCARAGVQSWLVDNDAGRYCRLVKTMLTKLFEKKRKLRKFAITNSIFFKSTISDVHHRKTYMYINFQQNRVS